MQLFDAIRFFFDKNEPEILPTRGDSVDYPDPTAVVRLPHG